MPRRDYEDPDDGVAYLFEVEDRDGLRLEIERWWAWRERVEAEAEARLDRGWLVAALDHRVPGWQRRLPDEVGEYGPVSYGWFGDNEHARTVRPNPRYL